ncbi:MAG: AbiV family abortive infection protein [Candidatus Hodarchaeales archaeon]
MENLSNYINLTLICYENAVALIEDAQLLVKKGTPGHAQALAVLAFEEWTKFVASLLLLMGLLKKENRSFKDLFWSHSHKHRSAFSFMFLSTFFQWTKASEISHETFASTDEYIEMSLEEKFTDFQE